MDRAKGIIVAAAVAVIGLAGVSTVLAADNPPAAAPAEQKDDQMMRKAHRNLLEARLDLKNAVHEFAGHRQKAHDLTEQALKDVDAGLAIDPATDKMKDSEVADAQKKYKEHEKNHETHLIMQGALEHLNSAKANLTNAPHDYSGHRASALKLVDQAIEEVNAGLAAAQAEKK